MYKIGEFSVMAKTTIKTLRYYEKEGLLIPVFIDKFNGYRYYDVNQLVDLSKIISLRQIGLSIRDIKSILDGNDIRNILNKRKIQIENNLTLEHAQLSKINYLLEEKDMKEQILFKKLPGCTIYYKEGIIDNFSQLANFIVSSGEECLKLNPNIKCIESDYCYVNYLDGEYRENNIRVRYAQAVVEKGLENDSIKFMDIEPVDAVCIYHKGSYDNFRDSYNTIMNYIEENNYEIIDFPREHYIDGCWNKDNENDYLTEIQVPIRKK